MKYYITLLCIIIYTAIIIYNNIASYNKGYDKGLNQAQNDYVDAIIAWSEGEGEE